MTVTLIENGDIFETDMQTLVCPVNCVGVMGKGLAKVCKKRWPHYFQSYKALCDDKRLVIGRPIYHTADRIISFPTKGHWRDASEMYWIKGGLYALKWNIEEGVWDDIESLAVPALGCGEGGLDWEEVSPLLMEHFATYDISVKIYAPREVMT